MKKVLLATGITIASFFGTFNAKAAEKNNVDWTKVALLDGVHRVQCENGTVKSFVAVGSARISKVLGAVKGKKIAQTRARLQAKAEIVKWMKSNVKSFESSSDESIIMTVGDGNSVSESGKNVEKSTGKYEEFAEGLIRGTTVIYSAIRTKGNEQEVVIVLGWSAENVKKASQAHAIMSGRTTPTQSKSENAAKGQSKTNNLPNEEIVSDEASDF